MYDTLILGAGPAGMSAAVYAHRAGLHTAIVEVNPMSGGQIVDTYEVDNYLGLPGMNGFDLAMKFQEHVSKFEIETLYGNVTKIETRTPLKAGMTETFAVIMEDGNVHEAKSVILATGATHAKLSAPGENEFGGKGVSYCATCDGAFFRGKTVAVVGGGDVAVEDAIFLARGCEKVYLIHRRNELRAAKILQDEVLSLANVEPVWESVVETIAGEAAVTRVETKNVKTGATRTLDVSACFIAVGIIPRTSYLKDFVDMDEKGYVVAGETGATSVPGIFAAGDLRTKRLRQIVTAVADGACAATSAADYLTGKQYA